MKILKSIIKYLETILEDKPKPKIKKNHKNIYLLDTKY